MRITISDNLADRVLHQLPAGTDVDQLVEARLAALAHLPAGKPFVVLSYEDLVWLGARLGHPGIPTTAHEICRAVDRLADVHMGSTHLTFTPAQLVQIQDKARKHGLTPASFIAQVAARVLLDMFSIDPAADGTVLTLDAGDYLPTGASDLSIPTR